MPTNRPLRAALYIRVSTDEQADKKTYEVQEAELKLYSLDRYLTAGIYLDDGVSGKLPVGSRPQGKRLMADARAGKFDVVLIHRIDRWGRKQSVILNATEELEGLGIGLDSVKESFETVTPSGRAMFQMAGSFAEMNRSALIETMVAGRNRYVTAGRWITGVVPFGYDLDEAGCLTPSSRPVGNTGMTEADVARSIFEAIAAGSTTTAEARRMNTLGVRSYRRYGSGKETQFGRQWLPARVGEMVKSTTYRGVHTFKAKTGAISREVPALVDDDTWYRAVLQLGKNRRLPTNANRDNLLRGLLICSDCKVALVGGKTMNGDKSYYYYRCGNQFGSSRPMLEDRCRAKGLPAKWIEDKVWRDVCDFIRNPGPVLAEAAELAQSRVVDTSRLETERDALARELAAKAGEREFVMTMARRNHTTVDIDEVTRQLDAIRDEQDALRARLETVSGQLASTFDADARYADAESLLLKLTRRLKEIETTEDFATKRRIVEALVIGIDVYSEGAGRAMVAHCRMQYAFSESVVTTGSERGTDSHHILQISRETIVPARTRSA